MRRGSAPARGEQPQEKKEKPALWPALHGTRAAGETHARRETQRLR